MTAHYTLILWLASWTHFLYLGHCGLTKVPIRRITGKFIFPWLGTNHKHESNRRMVSRYPTDTQQPFNRETTSEQLHRKYEHETRYTVRYQVMYVTHLSIGTPPQPFRAILDITQSNLFVPSLNCTDQPVDYEVDTCLYHLMYDSLESLTYQPDLTPAQVHYYGVYTWGNLSQDTVHIGDISVEKQTFQEATLWHPGYMIDWDEQYDSVLGLARLHATNTYDDFDVPSLVEHMAGQNALDRNVFALRHPHTDADEGELILGSVDESLTDSVVRLPLVDVPLDGHDSNFIPFASAGWAVAASSLTLDSYDDQDPLTIPLPDYMAVLTNGFGNIMLPQRMADKIAEYFHWDDWLDNFDCSQRDRFPNLTITLGPQKHDFVISPWQYMPEVTDPEGHQRCLLPFEPLYQDAAHPDYILLGGAFLASFYAEFDMDQKTIGLANYTRV